MKITKNQLRRIIKEEKAKLVAEAAYFDSDVDMAVKELMAMLNSERDVVSRNAVIYGIIDQLEELVQQGQ